MQGSVCGLIDNHRTILFCFLLLVVEYTTYGQVSNVFYIERNQFIGTERNIDTESEQGKVAGLVSE